VRSATAARESLSRLQEFVGRAEIDDPVNPEPVPYDSPNTLCMRITNARFEWGDGEIEHPHIPDLTLDLHRGSLYGIIGDVGSCKSFLGAIMGQLKMTKGSVGTFYKVARFRTREVLPGFEEGEDYGAPVFKFGYVPQEPWLIDGTLRDNIVFGEEWDDDKYAQVVRVSGLIKDMMALAEGDQSDLADLTLTSSQKQRISLARCLYHESDIYLFEDNFEDFESGAGMRLFTEVVKNYIIKDLHKCVVFYTQQKKVSKCV
jgi:ABC-type multidrug transport system fused ATPase/permease subunit